MRRRDESPKTEVQAIFRADHPTEIEVQTLTGSTVLRIR
jgi:hypothetical protein